MLPKQEFVGLLIGAARPVHILTPSTTARGVVNMTAVAVVEAQTNAGSDELGDLIPEN